MDDRHAMRGVQREWDTLSHNMPTGPYLSPLPYPTSTNIQPASCLPHVLTENDISGEGIVHCTFTGDCSCAKREYLRYMNTTGEGQQIGGLMQRAPRSADRRVDAEGPTVSR
ncbi:hypothetical protein ACOMHN_053523 [Nucella lapillus]